MSYMHIEFDKVQNCINSLNECSKLLVNYKEQIEKIQNSNINSGTWYAQVQRRFLTISDNVTREQQLIVNMKDSLVDIKTFYMTTEQTLCNVGNDGKGDTILTTYGDYDQKTRTFDDNEDNGTYGGDQGNMKHNRRGTDVLWWHWCEDKDLYDFIRKYDRYKNYSEKEIGKLLDQINEEGCGYVAFVNNIFLEYEGREEEFKNKFGFSMYDEDGKPNYDYLLVDFYANTDDIYYLDCLYGETALVNVVSLDYRGREEEFKAKYGCDLFLEGTKKINPEARQKILDEYQDVTEVEYESGGMTLYEVENRANKYLYDKGITNTSESRIEESALPTTTIDSYIDEGKNVAICIEGFDLYNQNNEVVYEDVGGHWMTITGVTEDGKYIVSSWGKKYYINPTEIEGICQYYISDITPS